MLKIYICLMEKILNVLSCCNGKNNVTMISKKIGLNTKEILKIIKLLKKNLFYQFYNFLWNKITLFKIKGLFLFKINS